MAATKTTGSATLEDATAVFAAEGVRPLTRGATVPATGTHATTTTTTRCCSACRARSCSTRRTVTSNCAPAIAWTWSRGRRTRRPSDRVVADASRPPDEGRVPRRSAVVQRARRHRHLREGDARRAPGGRPLVGPRAVPLAVARPLSGRDPNTTDGRYPGVEVPTRSGPCIHRGTSSAGPRFPRRWTMPPSSTRRTRRRCLPSTATNDSWSRSTTSRSNASPSCSRATGGGSIGPGCARR